MSPATHFLAGWIIADASGLNRKKRAVITLAAIIPDIDSLGLIAEILTVNSKNKLLWWSEYHHVVGHNLLFALLVAAIGFCLANRRLKTAFYAFLSFHAHLLGDLIGARAPDGDQWPIHYLFPFTDKVQLIWQGQWELNAWQNFTITIAALIYTFYLAWKKGYSPLEIFSKSADKIFVETLRNRFGSSRE